MKSIEEVYNADRALVYGIGGGGDIVGGIPTARFLESRGVDVSLGGIAWERQPTDPHPGPRRLDDFDPINKLSETVGLVSGDTTTENDISYTEAEVADYYDTEVALLDITKGIPALQKGLIKAAEHQDWDLIIGTDSGGDVLAHGTEPGVKSPLADGFSLVTLSQLSIKNCLGVFGYGSDGELTLKELETALSDISQRNGLLGSWGLTQRTVSELESLLNSVDTEASRLPVEAARGKFGSHDIRGGKRSVTLVPASTVTFYVNPQDVAVWSTIADALEDTTTLSEANTALQNKGLTTELPEDAVYL